MGLIQFNDIYRNKKILITGNSGFKGSWLSFWLNDIGAEVIGVSNNQYENSFNHLSSINCKIIEKNIDILNFQELSKIFLESKPDIVFHLAAQPLVRKSYNEPILTWATNVQGTAHVMDLCKSTDSVKAAVIVTTDKVYENKEWPWGYRETDSLGGHDPYSASKAASELVVSSYRNSYFSDDNSVLVATARAGNVIGGGDWSEDRLVPDLIRSVQSKKKLTIRYPESTRPWQHVLDSLNGYLMLGHELLSKKSEYADSWNFGPNQASNLNVNDFLTKFRTEWPEISWRVEDKPKPHEGSLLYLDNSKSKLFLKWAPVYDINKTVSSTVDWYRSYVYDKKIITNEQYEDYINLANKKNYSWIKD